MAARAETQNTRFVAPPIRPAVVNTIEDPPHILLLDTTTGTETKPLFITGETARQNQWLVKADGYTGQTLGTFDNEAGAMRRIQDIVDNGFPKKGTNTNLWDHKYNDGIPQSKIPGDSLYRGVSSDPSLALRHFIAEGEPNSYFVRFNTAGQEGFNIDKILIDNQSKLSVVRQKRIATQQYFNEVETSVINSDAHKFLNGANLYFKNSNGRVINMGQVWKKSN